MITENNTPAAPSISADEINRLWQHGMHEEKLFHDRLNYFSLIEMSLLTMCGIMYNKEPAIGFFVPLVVIALAFTLLWLVIQARHWSYCEHIVARQKRMIPDYQRTIDEFSEKSWARSFSISKVLGLSIPVLFACAWLAFLAWLLIGPTGQTAAVQSLNLTPERFALALLSLGFIWIVYRLRRVERRLMKR